MSIKVKKLIPQKIILLIPVLWLFVFFFIPFLIVFKISLSETTLATPPYNPLFLFDNFIEKIKELDFDNYLWLLEDPLYFNSLLSSFFIAAAATFFTLCVGYPFAYSMACAPARLQPVLFILIILPFWTSFLIRIYAWVGILKPEGLINNFLLKTGFIEEPLIILHTYVAVIIGIVYAYLPFMILPLYVTLIKIDKNLIDAARDLGCKPLGIFWKIIFPLSYPGIIAGSLLVFIPAMGEFIIPDLLGGSETLMIGKTLWNEFFSNRDWPLSSAVAVVLLFFLLIPMMIVQNQNKGKSS